MQIIQFELQRRRVAFDTNMSSHLPDYNEVFWFSENPVELSLNEVWRPDVRSRSTQKMTLTQLERLVRGGSEAGKQGKMIAAAAAAAER